MYKKQTFSLANLPAPVIWVLLTLLFIVLPAVSHLIGPDELTVVTRTPAAVDSSTLQLTTVVAGNK